MSTSVPNFSKVVAAVAINTTVGAASGCIATLFIAMAYQYFTLGEQPQPPRTVPTALAAACCPARLPGSPACCALRKRWRSASPAARVPCVTPPPPAGVVVWDLIIAGNGALAGLVAITGPCAFVQTWAAFIIGAIGGFVYFVASKVNLSLLKVGRDRGRGPPTAAVCMRCWPASLRLSAGTALPNTSCLPPHPQPTPPRRLTTRSTRLPCTRAAASGACWPAAPLPPPAWSPTCMAPRPAPPTG